MKRIVYASIFLLCVLQCMVSPAYCQDEEKCTVSLLDNRMATKVKQKMDQGEDLNESKIGLVHLGEFKTKIEEERLTSKSFKIPGTKQFVIASVYYTDESMGWKDVPTDSVYVCIAI